MSASRGRCGWTIGNRGERRSSLALGAIASIAILGLAMDVTRAQEPGATPAPVPTPTTESAPAQPPAATAAQPLSLRYRFVEHYGLAADPTRPDQIVAYQVGARQTVREETENPRGAPDRREITMRTVYTERPGQLGRRGEIVATVRRYDGFRILSAAPADPRQPVPLKGLTLWYHPRPGETPELIVLPPERPIREGEFSAIAGEVYFPNLNVLFPPRPARIGDTWKLGATAARMLMTGLASGGVVDIEANLSAVERAGQGNELIATIDLSGPVDFEDGNGEVRARLWFTFQPAVAAEVPANGRIVAAKPDPELVEARGFSSKFVMSLRHEIPLDENRRLLQTRIGELHMERRRVADPAASTLIVPDHAPPLTPANSWILYDDPEGRFHFQHPQELVVKPIDPTNPSLLNPIGLVHFVPNQSADVVLITGIPRDEAVRNRTYSDPAAHLKAMRQEWDRRGYDMILGQQGWLPEEDGAQPRRRVYRIEAALKAEGSRLYLDDYIVVMGSGEVFSVQARTGRDDHIAFRAQAETLIRSLGGGSSIPGLTRETRPAPAPRSGPAGPATTPAPGLSAPRDDLMKPPPIPRLNDRP